MSKASIVVTVSFELLPRVRHVLLTLRQTGFLSTFSLRFGLISASASLPPLARYNGKLMNSIWGLYNMYGPHAFQKNTELAPGAAQSSVAQSGSR